MPLRYDNLELRARVKRETLSRRDFCRAPLHHGDLPAEKSSAEFPRNTAVVPAGARACPEGFSSLSNLPPPPPHSLRVAATAPRAPNTAKGSPARTPRPPTQRLLPPRRTSPPPPRLPPLRGGVGLPPPLQQASPPEDPRMARPAAAAAAAGATRRPRPKPGFRSLPFRGSSSARPPTRRGKGRRRARRRKWRQTRSRRWYRRHRRLRRSAPLVLPPRRHVGAVGVGSSPSWSAAPSTPVAAAATSAPPRPTVTDPAGAAAVSPPSAWWTPRVTSAT